MEGSPTTAAFLKSWAPVLVPALVLHHRSDDLASCAAALGAPAACLEFLWLSTTPLLQADIGCCSFG